MLFACKWRNLFGQPSVSSRVVGVHRASTRVPADPIWGRSVVASSTSGSLG
jgi:hypothetical protein